ncbi:MAG: hypothetical protein TREMPRED_002495 [Tremellales sp. Tagirdzhanova-0007]|nr:MAG: hypothetical protein TREMPRED_002495 [Tremellales sp. Tagirdzhanova-0007]
MSLLLRSTPIRTARSIPFARQQLRFAHFENTVDTALPTSLKNKYWLAVKIIIYAGTGFG